MQRPTKARAPTSTIFRIPCKNFLNRRKSATIARMETSGRFLDIAKSFVLKSLPESQVELVGEVPFETIAPYRNKALAHIAEHIELPGFRPGKVPTEVALKKVGEIAVLEEAVELFVKDFYIELIEAHSVEAVGRPDIRVTKLAEGNPVGLVVRATVYPEVQLPKQWKTLHEKIALEPALPASDEEVEKTLEDLRQSRKQGDVVPELTDEFAKSVGAFDSLEHLKEQIRKGIGEEKTRHARDVRRGKLIEALLADSTLAVPAIFVDSELEKIMSQMREDVKRFGMELEDYFKKTGKTEEGVRAEFRDQAQKRAKLQLVLNKIASEEKLEADHTAVEAEMKHALEHFPDANPELVKIHIETVLKNELALKLLEGEVANKTVA
jgi:FKBP-type peptidyl-prolyl cis-trans isomerase (trigger factor)